MGNLTCLFALGFLLFNNTLRANEPEKVTSTEEVSETAAKKERIKHQLGIYYTMKKKVLLLLN